MENTRSGFYTEHDQQVVRYYDYLYKFAALKINDKELAKDLVQETFLTAIEAKKRFKARSSELTWLTAILKYKIYRVYRNRIRSLKIVKNGEDLEYLSLTESEDMAGLDSNRHLNAIVNKEFITAIGAFIETLPKRWQQIYDLKYVNNEKTEVVCEKLKLSPNNFWVMSYRLKMALKHWYQNSWLAD